MAGSDLISVEQALRQVLADVTPKPAEHVALVDAIGRVLAEDVVARRTQPPFAASAMDGYAVRASDVGQPRARLSIIGESAAGRRFDGVVRAGEAVRIFTGAPVPDGADTILIQEHATRDGNFIFVDKAAQAGASVRAAGLDFEAGNILLSSGRRLDGFDLALAGAMGHAKVAVAGRPRVAIIATGDELVPPGAAPGPDQIVASNNVLIAGLCREAGAEVDDLGIAPDRTDAIAALLVAAQDRGADVIVTLGGASVGDHDLVKPALAAAGFSPGFWRIAMRPGKPLIHARKGATVLLGLPGNPVSSAVCGLLFLVPLVRALQGDAPPPHIMTVPAILGASLKANGDRVDFMRATVSRDADGRLIAVPFALQDSAMLSILARSDALIVRPIDEPAQEEGAECRILPIRLGHGLAEHIANG